MEEKKVTCKKFWAFRKEVVELLLADSIESYNSCKFKITKEFIIDAILNNRTAQETIWSIPLD